MSECFIKILNLIIFVLFLLYKVATGGLSDEKSKVDLTRFWAEQDVEFMASMLRGTCKFHAVPEGEEEHQLTYEEEEKAKHTSSSIRATSTPKSFDDQSKTYRIVRPSTPTPTTRLVVPRHPYPLSPIDEAFEPHFPTQESPRGLAYNRDLIPSVHFEQDNMPGKVSVPSESKWKPQSHFETSRLPSPVPNQTHSIHPPTEQ